MFLDTSGLLALLDVREPQHQKSRDQYARASSRFTHAFVLAEFIALSNARGVPSSASLQFLQGLLATPDVAIVGPMNS